MPSTPPNDPAARAEHVLGLRTFAFDSTIRVLGASRDREALAKLMSRLRRVAGAELEIAGPCPLCVTNAVPTPVPTEVAVIQSLLESFSDQDKKDLLERCEIYAQQRYVSTGSETLPDVACPFLVNGDCLICKARPLGSRIGRPPLGVDPSAQPGAEEMLALEFGHVVALRLLGLDHHRIDLGTSVSDMLADPGWIDRYLAGAPSLREHAKLLPTRDQVIEQAKAFSNKPEASGIPFFEPNIEQATEAIRVEGLRSCLPYVRGVTALEQVWTIQVPRAYRSEEEIDEWRSYFSKRLDEVEPQRWDSVEAFDALSRADTFGLAYQGRTVRDLLEKLGDRLVEPIVRRALPDLVQPIERKRRSGKLRVGYLSTNIKGSNGGLWSRGWIANHGDDIETYVFATTPVEDSLNVMFRQIADHYYHCPSDVPYTARFIKSLDLDVLIFTDIGLPASNYQHAAMRLAPVQCTAWGHPVTSGLSTIDYYLSSELMEPADAQKEYREKLVLLPGSGLFMTPKIREPQQFDRRAFGIPEGYLVFAPNNIIKWIPKWDELMAKISQKLDRDLVLIDYRPYETSVTQQRLDQVGCRTTWVPMLKNADFTKLMDAADLVIDAPAWSGGNTTLDAIALGKPVVTLPGEFMRARHSYAFLKQAGMDNFIAETAEEFVAIASDRDLHARTMANADIKGPFRRMEPVQALDDWMRTTLRPDSQ